MTDSFPELAKVAVHVVAPVVGFKGKSVHDEIAVPPTENVTVPWAGPDTELTVAVSDTGVPLATEDVGPESKVVVDVGVGEGGVGGAGGEDDTVSMVEPSPELKFESPPYSA